MKYLFQLLPDDAAQTWWDAVVGSGAVEPSGQIRAHAVVDSTSHMVVETSRSLLCCTKDPSAVADSADGAPAWRATVDEAGPETALVRLASPAGTPTEFHCASKLVDDLLWYDPDGDLAVRLVRGMSEFERLDGRREWHAELASALEANASLIAQSNAAMVSASHSVQSGRPMGEGDVQRLLASDAALVDALASLRELSMRGNLIDHTLKVASGNLRAFIGEHHTGVADQILAPVTAIRAQNDHDLALLGYAVDQLEGTQARTTQLFERSRYIIDVARESTGVIQGSLFAAVGIALTVVQVLALPNVRVPAAVSRETPLVIVSCGALAFVMGVLLSRRAIAGRKLFWGAVVGGLCCPLLVLAARLAL